MMRTELSGAIGGGDLDQDGLQEVINCDGLTLSMWSFPSLRSLPQIDLALPVKNDTVASSTSAAVQGKVTGGSMEAGKFLAVSRKHIYKVFLAALFLSCTGCVSFARVDGPYEGWVIDAATKQPVEGVVVHGDWYKVWGTVGGASSEWYDSAETLTDRNGAFKIPGKGLLLLTNVDELDLTIFKAGYKQWPPNSWSGLKGKWSDDEVTWDGNRPIFRLKRLSMEERRERGPVQPGAPNNKQRLFVIERNKEMIETGRPSNTLLPVE